MARILTVKVQARSKAPVVEELEPDVFWVRVRAAPEKGRANREVIELLAGHLSVPPSRLTLIRGGTSSRKLIRVEP